MYDIRQFKPCLYILLTLGITGFALAAQSPGIWVLAMVALALNAWLIKTRRFKPIPHWTANVFTIFTMLVLVAPLRADASRAVLVIGQFLVVLQLVKVYEQRANRDYAQLLILSLLLMVAASINTASLVFGILLIAYLFLSLFCCLLFHLKVETDYAKAAIGIPEVEQNPTTLRQDQRYLSRSMRRLTGAVASVAIVMAIAVFILFPRGAGAGLLGPLQIKQSQSLSGFSDTVSFQNIAKISTNSAEVMWVKVFEDGKPVRGIHTLLMRGLTFAVYTGDDSQASAPRTWTRGLRDDTAHDAETDLRVASPSHRFKQEISLLPTGTAYLFAMPGLCRLDEVSGGVVPRYSPRDETLQTGDAIQQRITYTVESDGHVMKDPNEDFTSPTTAPGPDGEIMPTRVSAIPAEIEPFARRAEVSGVDAQGPLAARRDKNHPVDPLDPIIARNICDYLQRNFTYTLDLTDAKNIGNRDPLVAFLYDFKRGHCEYFAGAMTLMCQSLGMQARFVVGFKCDDYNSMLGQYVVRQSHAHAWVEVLDSKGEWQTFDPTSGRDADNISPATGMWRKSVQFVQYLQYTWANAVVAYDQEARTNLITNVDRSLSSSASSSQLTIDKIREWISDHVDMFASRASVVLMAVMVVGIIAAIFFFVFDRIRMRRRARRIGLEQLPASDQVRLLRQLGFYDDLLKLLERHRIVRPAHLTPLEFSRSINFLPHEVFDAIHRVTVIFYHVRYGRHELSTGQRRHLSAAIAKINECLGRPT